MGSSGDVDTADRGYSMLSLEIVDIDMEPESLLVAEGGSRLAGSCLWTGWKWRPSWHARRYAIPQRLQRTSVFDRPLLHCELVAV
jgi:hypothetical protein